MEQDGELQELKTEEGCGARDRDTGVKEGGDDDPAKMEIDDRCKEEHPEGEKQARWQRRPGRRS
jgi:hypothetical protein